MKNEKCLHFSIIYHSDCQFSNEMEQLQTILSHYLAKLLFTASFIIALKSVSSLKWNFNIEVELHDKRIVIMKPVAILFRSRSRAQRDRM